MVDKGARKPRRNDERCAEPTCNQPLPEGAKHDFCKPSCYRKHRNRAMSRGFRLYDVAVAWRTAPRSHQRGAQNPPTRFGDVTFLIDEYLREDREMREATSGRLKPNVSSLAKSALSATPH